MRLEDSTDTPHSGDWDDWGRCSRHRRAQRACPEHGSICWRAGPPLLYLHGAGDLGVWLEALRAALHSLW